MGTNEDRWDYEKDKNHKDVSGGGDDEGAGGTNNGGDEDPLEGCAATISVTGTMTGKREVMIGVGKTLMIRKLSEGSTPLKRMSTFTVGFVFMPPKDEASTE